VLFRSVDRAVRMLSAAMPCECASQHVAGQTRGRGVAPVPKYRSTQSKIMISITSNRRALGGDAIEASRSTYMQGFSFSDVNLSKRPLHPGLPHDLHFLTHSPSRCEFPEPWKPRVSQYALP